MERVVLPKVYISPYKTVIFLLRWSHYIVQLAPFANLLCGGIMNSLSKERFIFMTLMVTVSDINGLFFLVFLNKIYSKTGI